jgi:O-antigen/teichoic acid export membrane protein
VPTVLNTQLGAALLSNGKAWTRTGVDALLAVTFLAAAGFAVPRWNAAGLAGAFLLAYSAASVALWICLRHNHASFEEGAAL